MQNKFIIYDRFSELATFEHFTNLLQQHNIPFETENNAPSLDNTFGRNDFAVYYFVKILKVDFPKVDKIQKDDALQTIHQLGEDYYLYDFSNDELLEIVQNKDEWSTLDFVMAKKLLKDKGVMNSHALENKVKEAESLSPKLQKKNHG